MSSPRRSGIITLTSDFGRSSSYVGSLRGALLSQSTRLVLADLSHDVPPFDVMAGALLLKGAVPAFPDGTVHLAVVDPGVGGRRRPLIVVSPGRLFVGPDNGLFTPFLAEATAVIEIDPRRAAPGDISATFHGRDLFAPAAAHLALGAVPEDLGAPLSGEPVRLDWPEPEVLGPRVAGAVLHVDSFGNLITNIPEALLPAGGRRCDIRIEIAGSAVNGVSRTYADGEPGDLVAVMGSGALLEVAVVRGSAAVRLGAGRGTPLTVMMPGSPDPR